MTTLGSFPARISVKVHKIRGIRLRESLYTLIEWCLCLVYLPSSDAHDGSFHLSTLSNSQVNLTIRGAGRANFQIFSLGPVGSLTKGGRLGCGLAHGRESFRLQGEMYWTICCKVVERQDNTAPIFAGLDVSNIADRMQYVVLWCLRTFDQELWHR